MAGDGVGGGGGKGGGRRVLILPCMFRQDSVAPNHRNYIYLPGAQSDFAISHVRFVLWIHHVHFVHFVL